MLELIEERHHAHGLVVVYRLPHWSVEADVEALTGTLLAAERDPLQKYVARRKLTYAGGRYALRAALRALGVSPAAIGVDDRGAPVLPEGFRGSISHKDDVVAAIANRDPAAHVGIDIENVPGPSDGIADKILAPDELDFVRGLADDERALQLALRFSMKEAIYKALDPYVRRYVGYREVEVWPEAGGTARVVTNVLPGGRSVDVHWQRLAGYVVTTARL